MKFIKLKLKNFKPYYEMPSEEQEIILFDEERKDKNITTNIGQTGHGKTSISEALLWCIFGERSHSSWEEWVNSLAIKVAKDKRDIEVPISVELVLEIEGDHYRLIRSATYNIANKQKLADSKLSILHNGGLISEDSESFIAHNFPPVGLMKYFVFDADDILKKFEDNRERTIKDHINKIVGVEKLNKLIASLEKVRGFYEDENSEIERAIQSDIAEKIKTKKEDVARKEDAIASVKEEIRKLKEEKSGLIPKPRTLEIKNFSDLVDKKDSLIKDIDTLNDQFQFSNGNIIPNMDLLLLEDIILKFMQRLNNKGTTEKEFTTSSYIIKSSLKADYSGILFDESERARLIKKGTEISEEDLDDVKNLNLESGEGLKTLVAAEIEPWEGKINNLKTSFESYKKDFESKMKDLMRVKNQIDQIGVTTENEELRAKYKELQKIERRIKEKEELLRKLEKTKEIIKKEIEDLRGKLDKNKEDRKELERIEERKKFAQVLLDLSKKIRKNFLEELLSYVNQRASESLRSTVKDIDRFHSIEIDSDYVFEVKQKNGDPLEDSQINRGTLQIALMSFFFGLSQYLEEKNEIPYVIDDPLIRLDPGHDKRLIEQLSKTHEQIIFHMIPGKEYTTDSYKWLKNHINTQNWIYRGKYKNMELISHVERKEPDYIVKFDIDTF